MNHCNCWNRAPTVPVFRDDTKHLDDCPARDSGQKVGVNPQLGNYIVEGEYGVFYEFPANSEEKAARLSLEESAIVRQSIADQDARIVELEAKVESLRAELSQAQKERTDYEVIAVYLKGLTVKAVHALDLLLACSLPHDCSGQNMVNEARAIRELLARSTSQPDDTSKPQTT